MDILKQISLVIFCLLIFGCERKYSIGKRNMIIFGQWDNEPLPKNVIVEMYKKKTNFKILEKKDSSFSVHIFNNQMILRLKSFNDFPMNKDYIIILDKRRYEISDVYYSIDTMRWGSNSWDISTHADSFKVNGKMYRTDFIIPKEVRIE